MSKHNALTEPVYYILTAYANAWLRYYAEREKADKRKVEYRRRHALRSNQYPALKGLYRGVQKRSVQKGIHHHRGRAKRVERGA